jgi:hypothetical protein
MKRSDIQRLVDNVAGTARTSGRLREQRDEMQSSGAYASHELDSVEKSSSDALFASERAKTQAVNDIARALGIRE